MEQSEITKEILEELYLKKRLSTSQVGQTLKISQWDTRKWLKRFEIPTRTLSEAGTKYPKTPFSGDLREKAYILGLRTGDLYVIPHRKLIKVETTSSKPTFLKMFEKIFGKYSMVKVYEREGKITEKSFRIYCYLDPSFEFLIKKLDEIPHWILETDEHFFAFLAGYTDAEGSWVISEHKIKKWEYKDIMFSIKSCDKTILHQIHQRLKELGLKSHIYLAMKAGTSTQLGKYHSDLYRVVIYGKAVMKLAELILPLTHHADKQKRISEIIELEKMKIEKLGTVEIPCLYCGRKKVSKSGSYSYKGARYQRYKCPICKEIFSEQTIKRLNTKKTSGIMKEVSFNDLLEMAKNLHINGIKWHFHVLMKNCLFNENKEKFCIILENENTNEVFVTYFDEDPKKDAEKLENLFYRGIY